MNNALQLWDNQLSIITTPIPHVSLQNEVLVKVAFSGICGTDLHILAGEFPSSKCVILGHEFAGVVSEVGNEVKHVSVGDRYVFPFGFPCWQPQRVSEVSRSRPARFSNLLIL